MIISPFEQVYHSVYSRMLDAIVPSNFLLTAPIILPASEDGTDFTLTELTPGIAVTIDIDGKEVAQFVPDAESHTLTINLTPGRKQLVTAVDDAANRSSVLVASVYYATMLAGLAEDWFTNIRRDLEDHQRQLESKFSSRLLEHRLSFENLLPRTRAFRRQLVRMGVKALVSEMTTGRGVVDLTVAGTAQTPIVNPVASSKTVFAPHVHPLFPDAADFAGFEFHVWLLNTCVASWLAFIRLANNLDDDILKLLEVGESKVVVDASGTIEQHVFDFTASGCGLESILSEFLDCLSSIRAFILITISSDYAFELYGYHLDTEVDNPLGGRWLDSGDPLDSGVTLDTEDDIDPLAAGGDGWIGTGLDGRLDGAALDTLIKKVVPIADLERVYEGPAITALQTQALDTGMGYSIVTTSDGDITVVGMTTVIGWVQVVDNNFDPGDAVVINAVPFTLGIDWVAGLNASLSAQNIATAINGAPPWPGIVAVASGLSPLVALYVPYVGPPPVVTLAVVDGATTNFMVSGPQLV
jgi:hypothetical protein